MIAFPAVAALVSLVCAGVIGWDALQRPRPDRVIWTIAFVVFALAAGAEVVGSAIGWSAPLARMYYLSGAVLVVGILALGELYLLLGNRMPAIVPGIALLVVAISATVVWNAPIDRPMLSTAGWGAIERGPVLIALAATINAAGTVVLVGGALFSAVRLRSAAASNRRAAGCVLIALGATVVALGGTLTRFGQREFLYLAMTAGISVIFIGVLLARSPGGLAVSTGPATAVAAGSPHFPRLTLLPAQRHPSLVDSPRSEGILFIREAILPLGDDEIAATCLRWGATPLGDEPLTRQQAARAWAVRSVLPAEMKGRFDRLSLPCQAQLGELYAEVWSTEPCEERHGLA